MYVAFSPQELAAIRLAARLLNYPTIEMFIRDAAMNAARDVFDTDAPITPADAPVKGRDILSIARDER